MYISETANPSSRGGLNIMFQLATTIGILIASGINYGEPPAPAILSPARHAPRGQACCLTQNLPFPVLSFAVARQKQEAAEEEGQQQCWEGLKAGSFMVTLSSTVGCL